jgi:hypothetical protein
VLNNDHKKVLPTLMPSVMAFAARFGWFTVTYMKSKAVTFIIVACWHAKGLAQVWQVHTVHCMMIVI